MGKRLRIFLGESDYDLLEKLSKASGKSLSQFTRELLQNSLKQEMRDMQLLKRLIQKIEHLQEQQPQQLQSEIIIYQMKQNTVAVIECLLALSSEFFFDKKKHENFEKIAKEILEKIF